MNKKILKKSSKILAFFVFITYECYPFIAYGSCRYYGDCPLQDAARGGDLGKVKRLIELGVDVNAKDNNGGTLLHGASSGGHLETVKYLIAKGVDVNAKDKYGDTSLLRASWYGHLEIVKCLIEKGADVNAKDNDGRTPLDLARRAGKTEVVRFLELHEEKIKEILEKEREQKK